MNKKKIALIFGSSGQDGSLMCRLLIKKKFKVYAISQRNIYKNIKKLKINNKSLYKKKINYYDYKEVKKIIKKTNCDHIYFFGGYSSPLFSFKNYIKTLESHILPVYNILQAIYEVNKSIKFFNTSSAEIFKNTNKKLNENSFKEPNNPYGLAKLNSLLLVKFYRENFKLKCFSGILFNHESELRPKNFVIPKIINFIKKSNFSKKLKMGDVNIIKDWGWAQEYVEIIYKVMNKKYFEDFVLATGKSFKLTKVLDLAFKTKKLNWKNHVMINKKLLRPFEKKIVLANNNKLKNKYKIKPKVLLPEIINRLSNI